MFLHSQTLRPYKANQSANAWLSYLSLANALLASLITATVVPASQWSASPGAALFLALALPGHFFFLALLLSIPVRIASRFMRNEFLAIYFASVIYAIFILLILIDVRVFELYRFHLNGMVFNLLSGGEALQILAIPAVTWALLAACFAGLVGVQIWVTRSLFFRASEWHRGRLVMWIAVLSVMLLGQTFYAYSDARGDRSVTRMLRYIPWALPLTAKRALRKMGVHVVQAETPKLAGPEYASVSYPRNTLDCDRYSSSQHNTLLIVVDSLRFDMLRSDFMPNTARLAAESQVFGEHYSTGNATRFGIFGLLYGLPGSYWFPMLGEQRGSVLIDTMIAQEHQLFFYAAASWASPEFDRTALAAIAEEAVSGSQLQAAQPDDNRHRDSIVTDALLRRIEGRDPARPFFGMLFLDAPHSYSRDPATPAPFQPAARAPDYLAFADDYDPTPFFNLYKNSVYYDDTLIGQVVNRLRELGLLETTIVIVTSDHGQEFNDSGKNYWGHNSNFSRYQTRVPMIIRWPGDDPGKITHRTSHVDLVPTLMQRNLGCRNPFRDYSTGQNLFASDYRPAPLLFESWSRRAIMSANRIYSFENYGDTLVYDLDYSEVTSESVDNRIILLALERIGAYLQ